MADEGAKAIWEAQANADIAWLFEAEAFRVAPSDKPFWFTSGLIGPYFISAHYLCGGPGAAESLLSFIDAHADDARTFPAKLLAQLRALYAEHAIYKAVVDQLTALAAEVLPLSEVTHVAGGQRRDWFFAPMLAEKLEKPCLYIYNDLEICSDEGEEVTSLRGANVVNVADLLTVASSYTKKWVPAIEAKGGRLLWALNCVDRVQGGRENLAAVNITVCESLFEVSTGLFDSALERNLIDSGQHRMLCDFLADPHASMRSFLVAHPEFLKESLQSPDAKIRQRAELCQTENLYHLD
ncbi:MAG: hypothetical protein KDD69_00010 [Bdellovibrionales bacterium]|nr:hypothetical protein [Bdellovibrionales bacterium]